MNKQEPAGVGTTVSPNGPPEEQAAGRGRALQRWAVALPARPVINWAAGFGVMLLALRPLWTIPIQADDFLTLFDIYANGDGDILGSS